MIPHVCTVKHNPPASYGDCVRTSIASILDVNPAESVPHFMDGGVTMLEARPLIDAYVETLGYRSFWMAVDPSATRNQVLEHMGSFNPDVYYLLFGDIDHGRHHVVVCCGDRVAHDTAWYPEPITSPGPNGYWTICTFVPMRLVDR